MTDADDCCLQRGQPANRLRVLLGVECERRPPGLESGPRRDRVPGEEDAVLGEVEREVPRRMARYVQDLERPQLVALPERLVDRARPVLRLVEEDPELERVRPEGRGRLEADRLGGTVARDDVGLPLVG